MSVSPTPPPPDGAGSLRRGFLEKGTGRSMHRPPLFSSQQHAAPASPPFHNPGYLSYDVAAVRTIKIFHTDNADHTGIPKYSAPPPDVPTYACCGFSAAPPARDEGAMRTFPPYGSGCIRRFPVQSSGPDNPPPHPLPPDAFRMYWMVACTQHGKSIFAFWGNAIGVGRS
jgi:hypothetical protein